jgi:cytosine/adenosine deaminase-related metal-dependent hydrolase/ubiquinone/menaquinone biosynthesis C-methylase UbiE
VLPPEPATFDLWAPSYDDQPNPFLSLEERIVSSLLPQLRGWRVLDVGCGTGRWLTRLAQRMPDELIGIDPSPAMLERAAAQAVSVNLRRGACDALPVAERSADLVLSSFVLSYMEDLTAFANELARVTRSGATVILSDLHPVSALRLHWRRTFYSGCSEVEIVSHRWDVAELVSLLQARGFHLRACVEAPFAQPEQPVFQRAGKSAMLAELQATPAIVALSFVREEINDKEAQLVLTGTRVALSPHDSVSSTISVTGGRIEALHNAVTFKPSARLSLDLSGYLILPGLINAHDHLEFGLFPRLGHGPYRNAKEWGDHIHEVDAELIALNRSIPRDVRAAWGAIRNLLCGVTTVCHHNPITANMCSPDFPVTVLQQFSWSHSLAQDSALAETYSAAHPDLPFILHAAEGTGSAAAGELAQLDRMGLLTQRTILVHGLALAPSSARLLNSRQSALIACPSSNDFLFQRLPRRDLLTAVERLALGSDSPLTAIGDLLDELRFARTRLCLDEELLYRMVTTSSAEILRLTEGEGRIAPGGVADLIAVRDSQRSPAATLGHLSASDVALVVRNGRVVLADDELYGQLPGAARHGLEPLLVDGQRRWLLAPLEFLFQQAAPLLRGGDLFLGGKQVRHG